MYDGIKMLDVSVRVDALLTNERLTFGELVDTQNGLILDPTRKALVRGLLFRLVPRRTRQGHRVEVKGSLHKFHNNGQHNADQFRVNNLLQALNELVCDYGFNPFQSRINNLEFGVNVELPFSVGQFLKNLVCYKNEPFYLDTHSDTPYYVCDLQRYAVKIYDKGKQKRLTGNLLRFEIRVKKMEYFSGKGIHIHTLSDLLNVANYKPLGVILVNTFNEILFDDSAIDLKRLPKNTQEIYRNGRNPRYWQIPDALTTKQANAYRQRLNRDRQLYRVIIEQYGGQWRAKVAALISQTWYQLTALDADIVTKIDEVKRTWQNLLQPDRRIDKEDRKCVENDKGNGAENCHKLTDVPPPICHKLTAFPNTEMSQINPLYSGLDCDSNQSDKNKISIPDPPPPGGVICPVTGIAIESPRPRQRFVSATQLMSLYTTDRRTFDDIAARFLTAKQAVATLDKQCYYMAHNIRNAYANQFNNPLRVIKKYQLAEERQTLLFPFSQGIKLTHAIQAGIDYRKGTRYEIDL